MMKRCFSILVMVLVSFALFAGDVAEFKDLGFSQDGSVYVFGQYGMTDKSYEGYAEIYAVDVKNNAYVENGVFRAKPSAETSGVRGKEVFEKLYKKADYFFSKYKMKPTSIDNVLYLRGSKANESNIRIKDFENSTVDNPIFYNIKLVPYYEGKGEKGSGSFYITVQKEDSNGKVLSKKTVGNPDRKRKGVVEYSIEKILTTTGGKNLVIVVEKKVEDKSGISIRYMVETLSY